ncbi:tail fiber/spike domain-containing protein [Pectobacterium carotovorum]|uniref:tail fiber/spike domain-containing protein n=1 Tax=Pectobacterium carotovorum TaxID=554 RepID=UPI0037FA0642
MTTYNTRNPLGSAAAKDLYDNAENLDVFVNDTQNESLPDRLGAERRTWFGLQQLFLRAMEKMGWIPFGTFEVGATLTDATQTLKYEADGNYYRWDGDFDKLVSAGSTPASTGGVAQGAWVNVTDLTLRDALDNHSGFPAIEDYLDRNALRLRYATLAELVAGTSYGGPVDFSKFVGKIVTTDFHNNAVSNTSPGGGARYVIQSTAEYGTTPDGTIVNSVLAGADHYVGGGTNYVAKYLPNKDGSVDGEALGLYQGQAMENATTVFEKAFVYCGLRNPVRNGDSRVIALPNKIFSYDNQYQGIDNDIYNINIRGAKMPEVLEDLSGLHGGTIIKGRMALQIRRGEFSHFGIDGGATATGSWPYNWDGFKAFTDTQAYAGSIRLYQVMALGRDFNQTSHAIVLGGYKKSVVRDCQGYNTWYGLSIDALESIVDGFIGGNNYRNVVNAKSHPNSTQQSSNKSMTISNIVGFGTTSEGANVGSAIVAVESDGGQVERVVINNVVGRTARALLAVTPYNGAVINELVISNLAGGDFDATAINVAAGSGGGAVYSLFLRDVSISNVKAKAALFANTRYLNVDGLFATKGAAANASFNTDFVEIASTTTSPDMRGITLVDNFNTSSFTGALLWNNTDASKARRSHMRCSETGSGKPLSLG